MLAVCTRSTATWTQPRRRTTTTTPEPFSSPTTARAKETKQKKANLIVLGVRQRSGFPGAATHLPMATAHQVVSRAERPVLTVRG